MRLVLLCVPPAQDDFHHKFCMQTVKGKAAAKVCFQSLPSLFCRNFCAASNYLFTLASLLASVPGRIVIPRRVVVSGRVFITWSVIAFGRMFDVGFLFISGLRRRGFPEESFPFADNRRRRNVHPLRLGHIIILTAKGLWSYAQLKEASAPVVREMA